MPRDILIQIINGNLVVELFIILIVYFAVDWVIFRLIFQMLGVEKKFKELLPGILLIIIYNTCGKQILPAGLAYGLTLAGLLVITIKVIARDAVTWMQAFWCSFLSYFIVVIGVLLFEDPLFSMYPAIARFIIKTPLGIAVGTILGEGIFPLIALFLLKTIDISVIPPVKRKVNLVDAANLYLFAGMFALLYNNSVQLLKNIETSSRLELIKDNIFQFFLVGSLVAVYYWAYTTTNRRHKFELKAERERTEEERLLREEAHRRHEAEQQRLEETIDKLEKQNTELSELNENLKTAKLAPKKLSGDIASLIDSNRKMTIQLEELNKSLINQSDAGSIFENDFLTEMVFNETEIKIIERIIQGETNAEIAKALGYSTGYVRNIITEILEKTGSRDRTVLAIRYIKSKFKK